MANKEKVKCPNPECKYEWETESKLINITCPSCMKKFKRGDNGR